MPDSIPLGKLPPELLADMLARHPIHDPRVILGPRPGEDAAVLDIGDQYLIAKTDPITFATDEIGWYAVNVNANDIAVSGGTPTWFMATILFPEGQATPDLVNSIFEQIQSACHGLDITLVGGHSEITYGIDRPIIIGLMLGLARKNDLITTGGAQPGDTLLVTKGIPIEATTIIAREKAAELRDSIEPATLRRCENYLHNPGISVVRDAAIAMGAGRVHAMHDPTEGGLATGLWEMADAAGKRLVVDLSEVTLEDGQALCEAVGINPLGAIASGALLLAVDPSDTDSICNALTEAGIAVHNIGHVEDGRPAVTFASSGQELPRPTRDEIARLFE